MAKVILKATMHLISVSEAHELRYTDHDHAKILWSLVSLLIPPQKW